MHLQLDISSWLVLLLSTGWVSGFESDLLVGGFEDEMKPCNLGLVFSSRQMVSKSILVAPLWASLEYPLSHELSYPKRFTAC
jgi:hypothetical protein